MKKIKKRKKQWKKCKKYLKKLAFLPEIGYNINITYETLKEWEQIPLLTFGNKGGKKWQIQNKEQKN